MAYFRGETHDKDEKPVARQDWSEYWPDDLAARLDLAGYYHWCRWDEEADRLLYSVAEAIEFYEGKELLDGTEEEHSTLENC